MDQYDDQWENWTRWAEERYCCFSYILLFLPSVMLVSKHRECEYVAEEKGFPPLLCCAICLVLPCLGVCFVPSPITRRFIAAVIRRSTIVDLQKVMSPD